MPERILFFLSPVVTGAERVSITMAKAASLKGYEVSFAIIGDAFGEILNFIPKQYPVSLVRLVQLPEFVKYQHPDTVFCSLIDLNPYVQAAAESAGGIKVVLRNNYRLADVPKEIAERACYAYRKADLVIAQTEEMQTELMSEFGLDGRKLRVIENPIDKDYIDMALEGKDSPYPEDGKKHFCWIGRYDWIKGPDRLIDWFSRMHEEQDMAIYMIGAIDKENPCFVEIERIVHNSRFQDDIHMLGFDSNPYRWMKYSDGLIMSSRSEACSNVVREAGYLGTQVIEI